MALESLKAENGPSLNEHIKGGKGVLVGNENDLGQMRLGGTLVSGTSGDEMSG